MVNVVFVRLTVFPQIKQKLVKKKIRLFSKCFQNRLIFLTSTICSVGTVKPGLQKIENDKFANDRFYGIF